MGSKLSLRAALEGAVGALVRVPLVMRKPNVLCELIHGICLEAADWTCNLSLRVNVGFVSLKKTQRSDTIHLFGVRSTDPLPSQNWS